MYAWEEPFTEKVNGKSGILTFTQKIPIHFLSFINILLKYWWLRGEEKRKKVFEESSDCTESDAVAISDGADISHSADFACNDNL